MLLGSAVVASGCVDAKGKFQDFEDRVGTIDANTADRPASSIYDITGTFLMALETSQFPGKYVQFLATYELTEQTDGTALLDSSMVALRTYSANPDRNLAECPRSPDDICPPLVDDDAPVNSQGAFESTFVYDADHPGLPGQANPISGSTFSINATLHGVILSEDMVCGTVTGDVGGSVVNLSAGSTFASQRIKSTSPDSLPDPIWKCPDVAPQDAGVDAMPDAGLDAAL